MKIGSTFNHEVYGPLKVTKKRYSRMGNKSLWIGVDENGEVHELDGTEKPAKMEKESPKFLKEAAEVLGMAQGPKGEDADEDYIIEAVIPRVLEQIRQPEDGKPGADADTELIIREILPLVMEKMPKPEKLNEASIVSKVLSRIRIPQDGKPGEKGKDGSPDTPEQVKDKLETLKGDERLDASAIKNLPKPTMQFGGDSYTGLAKIDSAGTPGTLQDKLVAGTNVTITKVNDTLRIASSGGAGGDQVDSIVAGNNIDVDATDPANPIVSVETLTLADISDITASATELNYVDGVTSAIQTQLDGKVSDTGDTMTGTLVLATGSTTVSPIKFASGVSLTTAVPGAMEFTTNDLFFTITTGSARKRVALVDPVGGLTTNYIPYVTTNGRITNNANLQWDPTNARLGVGAIPSYRLHVIDTNVLNSGTNHTTVSSTTFTPTGAAYTTNLDSYYGFVSLGAGTAVDSAASAYIRGALLQANNASSRSINTLYGVTGQATNGTGATGTINSAYGIHGYIQNDAGTINNAFGAFSEIRNVGVGTITSGVGLYVDVTKSAGTITTVAGFKMIDHRATVTNLYGILTYGNSKFGGFNTLPTRVLESEIEGSATNAVGYPLRLIHSTSGTATTGFGTGQEFQAENASGTMRTVGTFDLPYTDATNATEDTDFKLSLIRAGTLTEAFKVSSTGTVTADGVVVPTVSSTNTLTNKRNTRRLTTTNAPGATPTTNSDNVDVMSFTGLNTAITSMTTNLSGTPVDGDMLEFRFTDDGTARGITWGASFVATTVDLPTTTVISTMLRVGFEYSGSTWKCIATC